MESSWIYNSILKSKSCRIKSTSMHTELRFSKLNSNTLGGNVSGITCDACTALVIRISAIINILINVGHLLKQLFIFSNNYYFNHSSIW